MMEPQDFTRFTQKNRLFESFILLHILIILFSSTPFAEETKKNEELQKILRENPEDPQALTHLEKAIQLDPQNIRYGNEYRMRCIRFQEYDRSIRFFETLVQEKPDILEPHMHLALAYVDKMPYQKLGIVGQGILSNKSIREFNKVLEMDSKNWAGIYGRAMNHLYWPRALKHAPLSISDFQSCIALQEEMNLKPYFFLPYIGLGDAFVKDRKHDKAREVWEKGLKLSPENEALKRRISLREEEELDEFVGKERGLGVFIDTNLSFLWEEE